MKILGVIPLYYPGSDLVRNINSFIRHTDKLMLIDNTPEVLGDLPLLLEQIAPDCIVYMRAGRNVGIGRVLNTAITYAREGGYTHLLTMDQDSYFKEGDFENYLGAIRRYGEDSSVIFSTNYFLKSQQSTLYSVSDTVDEVSSAMTSGSIYPISLFNRLGDFNEGLFVWGIDCEFSWRASRKNVPTFCFKNIQLQHDLGYQKKKHRLLGKEVFPNEYAPDRTYYNVRNGMILHRFYPDKIDLKAHLRYHLYKRVIFVLLYEDQKWKKWKALWDGYRDGKSGKVGERGKTTRLVKRAKDGSFEKEMG